LDVEIVHLQQPSAKLLRGSRQVPPYHRRIALQEFLNLLIGFNNGLLIVKSYPEKRA